MYDAVLLDCKGYDLIDAMGDIAPAIGPDSVVLPFLNGLGAYSLLDQRFGRARVLGGVAYIAVQMDADGAIRHLGPGDIVLAGARSGATGGVAQALFALLQAGPGTRTWTPDIVQALWDKWPPPMAFRFAAKAQRAAATCCSIRPSSWMASMMRDIARGAATASIRRCWTRRIASSRSMPGPGRGRLVRGLHISLMHIYIRRTA